MREGVAETIICEVDRPFGLSVRVPQPYRVQDPDPRPGEHLRMLTDGMLEHHGEKVDLSALLERTRELHPRETALTLTSAVLPDGHGIAIASFVLLVISSPAIRHASHADSL
ncbi:hypothetical protein [Streptomyces sp. NPDC102264]|uniref:hypothetical protein n=1 Tax=Streptomyces sp. NPDC102264 TaxID=3366149 RepID=UPI00381C0F2D